MGTICQSGADLLFIPSGHGVPGAGGPHNPGVKVNPKGGRIENGEKRVRVRGAEGGSVSVGRKIPTLNGEKGESAGPGGPRREAIAVDSVARGQALRL